jgi:hypothetical protein
MTENSDDEARHSFLYLPGWIFVAIRSHTQKMDIDTEIE